MAADLKLIPDSDYLLREISHLKDQLEPRLSRYPSIDPIAFRRGLKEFLEHTR